MPAKLERCVKDVKAKSGKKVNPYAVCVASTGLTFNRKDRKHGRSR